MLPSIGALEGMGGGGSLGGIGGLLVISGVESLLDSALEPPVSRLRALGELF